MKPVYFIAPLLSVVFLITSCGPTMPPDDPMPDGPMDGGGMDDGGMDGGGMADAPMDDGPVADGISAKLGDPLPSSTAEELALFERGKFVFLRQFDLADGLGPAFNVASCGACHERPTAGGSAGLYRNFFLSGQETSLGNFFVLDSAATASGVVRLFSYDADDPFRPAIPEALNVFAQRNPIPMFGMGLLLEVASDDILVRVDPDDADGDGISGRANFDGGVVGRFGRKAQTVSIEGFVRGPLFNHLGITTDPLIADQRAQIPAERPSFILARAQEGQDALDKDGVRMQVASPDQPTRDADGVPDPELSSDDLFSLVSFVHLLAAPQLDEPTDQSNRGRLLFHEAGCADCHTPRIDGPRGAIPVYSDLLLHDMGEALADGIRMGIASGSEFRTQPLWGIASVGPYLHDGRAETIDDAIVAHAGEGQRSRDAFVALTAEQRGDVIEFLLSLGGRDQFSTGLVEPDAGMPAVGEYGGPMRELSESETARFLRGRELYDHEFGIATGIGALAGDDAGPRFNGDSCRACHFAPTIGGGGPRGVNVMRHARVDESGVYSNPPDTPNTILHSGIVVGFGPPEPSDGINVFEHRQPPHTFGLGLIEAISDATIMSNADPTDADGDGVSGRAHVISDGRIGRFGWKAQVPSIAEFVRDAMAAEIGLTIEAQTGLSFGITTDDDGVADPELSATEAEDLAFFIAMLAPPPRQSAADADLVARGESVFATAGCAACHIPTLTGSLGDVPLYSDILLHEILPAAARGIVDGDAGEREFRTAPLWGISQSAPYFHTGEADTIDQAIRLHDGEATGSRTTYEGLTEEDRTALLAFLDTL